MHENRSTDNIYIIALYNVTFSYTRHCFDKNRFVEYLIN